MLSTKRTKASCETEEHATKYDPRTYGGICRGCHALSEWAIVIHLLRRITKGRFDNGVVKSIPLAESNWLEFLDWEHEVGKVHEEIHLPDWKAHHPELSYFQYLEHHRQPQLDKRVTYMSPFDRDACRVSFKDGRLTLPDGYPATYQYNMILHSNQPPKPEDYVKIPGKKREKEKHRVIFVADENHLYVAIKEEGVIQHSSFLSGRPAFMAGYFTLTDYDSGSNSFRIAKIKGKSGHYRPSLDQFVVFLWALEQLIPLEQVEASYATGRKIDGEAEMVKMPASQLLEMHRERVIPEGTPVGLWQPSLTSQEAPVVAESSTGAPTPPGNEQSAVRVKTKRELCRCCGCVVM